METLLLNATSSNPMIEKALTFLLAHPLVFIVAIIWLLVWKGLALWTSAGRKSVFWFVIFLVLNTASIGEIIYYICIKVIEKKEAKKIVQ